MRKQWLNALCDMSRNRQKFVITRENSPETERIVVVTKSPSYPSSLYRGYVKQEKDRKKIGTSELVRYIV